MTLDGRPIQGPIPPLPAGATGTGRGGHGLRAAALGAWGAAPAEQKRPRRPVRRGLLVVRAKSRSGLRLGWRFLGSGNVLGRRLGLCRRCCVGIGCGSLGLRSGLFGRSGLRWAELSGRLLSSTGTALAALARGALTGAASSGSTDSLGLPARPAPRAGGRRALASDSATWARIWANAEASVLSIPPSGSWTASFIE